MVLHRLHTLIACTTYLLYDWAKKKAILERIKKKFKQNYHPQNKKQLKNDEEVSL
ncbi:MAG: hypothetical protein QXE57_06500 [Nitrososphaerales archaeon]